MKKKVVVNRVFMNRLANLIHDPETNSFLRLCSGTLQNGPDPTNKKRPMHCGLGELYFAMTGKQPKDAGVSEEDVVDIAIEMSTLPVPVDDETREREARKAADRAGKAVKALKLPAAQDALLQAIDDGDFLAEEEETSALETKFRAALDAIPDKNDDSHGHAEACTIVNFRNRSKRVARQLRLASKYLPK